QAQTALDIEALAAPGQLHIGGDAANLIALIPTQPAAHAELVALEVLVAPPIVHRNIQIHAPGHDQFAGLPKPGVNPAGIEPVEIPLEIDDAAGMAGTGQLHGHGNRLELPNPSHTAIKAALPLHLTEEMLEVEPQLPLIDRLARIETQCVGRIAPGIVPVGVPGQPLRILGVVLLEVAVDERHAAV